MVDTLQRYVDPAFVYNFNQGPAQVRSDAEALVRGINCVALAHLAIKELFDYTLPPESHCYEMVSDGERFETVDPAGDIQAGDLYWFGWKHPRQPLSDFIPEYDATGMLLNWRDDPVTHVAIYTGNKEGNVDDGDPLLLHATNFEGTNAIWPLAKFARYRRYEKVYRVSRLILSKEAALV